VTAADIAIDAGSNVITTNSFFIAETPRIAGCRVQIRALHVGALQSRIRSE